jgi:hypothetical protein
MDTMIAPTLLEQIEQLPLKERLVLLEFLSRNIREELSVVEEVSEDDVDPKALFREGWADAMEGRTHPVSRLWDGIEDE